MFIYNYNKVYQKNNLEHIAIESVWTTPFYQQNDIAYSRLGRHELCIISCTFWTNHENNHKQPPNFSDPTYIYIYYITKKSLAFL